MPNHIYMYQDCHILANFVRGSTLDEELNTPESFNLECDIEPRICSEYSKEANDTPEVYTWKPWEGEIKPGYFYANDLDEVRRQLCSEG